MLTASSPDFLAYVLDQLGPIAGIRSGRFFGGTALWCDDVQFAMLMGNTLYFAVDDSTRPRYVAMGGSCFRYATRKGIVDVHRYHEVPADLLEDADALQALARESLQRARVAKRARIPAGKQASPKRTARGKPGIADPSA